MIRIVKKNGVKEELDEGKLWDSIYYPARECHYGEEEATGIADEAKEKVVRWMKDHDENVLTVKEIRETVIGVLEDIDEDVCFMYEKHLDIN